MFCVIGSSLKYRTCYAIKWIFISCRFKVMVRAGLAQRPRTKILVKKNICMKFQVKVRAVLAQITWAKKLVKKSKINDIFYCNYNIGWGTVLPVLCTKYLSRIIVGFVSQIYIYTKYYLFRGPYSVLI